MTRYNVLPKLINVTSEAGAPPIMPPNYVHREIVKGAAGTAGALWRPAGHAHQLQHAAPLRAGARRLCGLAGASPLRLSSQSGCGGVCKPAACAAWAVRRPAGHAAIRSTLPLYGQGLDAISCWQAGARAA